MRQMIYMTLSKHDHPGVELIEDEEDEDPIVTVSITLCDGVTINGDKSDVLNWIDELHTRSLLIR